MSFGLQTALTPSISDIALFTAESGEITEQEPQDFGASGNLKSGSKSYSFKTLQTAPHAKEGREYCLGLSSSALKQLPKSEKPSLMNMTAASAYRPSTAKGEGSRTASGSTPHSPTPRASVETKPTATIPSTQCGQTPHMRPHMNKIATPLSHASAKAQETRGAEKRAERQEKDPETFSSLANRKWTTEETREWWEERYHQKERGGDQQKRDQHERQDEEENPLRIKKGTLSASKNTSVNTVENKRKPQLVPPKMGVFALYYVLTKIGIQSDGSSNFSYKKEIEYVDCETTETHKKRLAELKEAVAKEQESARWGVASKVFSWIATFVSMIAGAVMIATGVGAVAGSMLLIGGLIQMTNQIMELSGGWRKIAALLPGDDDEKKGAVVAWMQIGVAVLCLILSGVGVIWGGYANFGEAASTATALMGGIAAIGHGVTCIGLGVTAFMFKDKIAEVKRFELRLAQLKHLRQDLMEKMEWGTDRLEKLFEDLAKALEFEEELFYADQMVYRR